MHCGLALFVTSNYEVYVTASQLKQEVLGGAMQHLPCEHRSSVCHQVAQEVLNMSIDFNRNRAAVHQHMVRSLNLAVERDKGSSSAEVCVLRM